MSGYYVLDGKIARKADFTEWARWYEKAKKRVDFTMVGDVSVSTVFLGFVHQYGEGPPLIFETLVFGGRLDELFHLRSGRSRTQGNGRARSIISKLRTLKWSILSARSVILYKPSRRKRCHGIATTTTKHFNG